MPGFVDEAQVHVKAGNGGAGAVSFRREAYVSKGGPDGGDGGPGGNVFLEASNQVVSLLGFEEHPFRRGGDGTHGSGKRRHGRGGADLVVPVPEGTLVHSLEGDLLADLVATGDRFLAAEGGRGGRGNARFLTNRLRAPAFAEQGELGEERWLNLELELMADVALVGFPNAGKSTLVARVSAARPKVADYPFTTLEPHLGVVYVGARSATTAPSQFVIADIPGLVEGAADGYGLGHRFLRHVERARVLLILVDLAHLEDFGPSEGRQPAEQVRALLHELERYRPELLDRHAPRRRLQAGRPARGRAPPLEELRRRSGNLGRHRRRVERARRALHGDRGDGPAGLAGAAHVSRHPPPRSRRGRRGPPWRRLGRLRPRGAACRRRLGSRRSRRPRPRATPAQAHRRRPGLGQRPAPGGRSRLPIGRIEFSYEPDW